MKNISIIAALLLGLTLVAVSVSNASLLTVPNLINKPAPRPITPRVVVPVTPTAPTTPTTPVTPVTPVKPTTPNTPTLFKPTTLSATSNADCVVNTTFITGTKYCVDAIHIYGNFPQSVVKACIAKNGGKACEALVTVKTKNGKTVTTHRYNYNFYKTFAK